jgi:2-dehydro-3-deoxygluconokinase
MLKIRSAKDAAHDIIALGAMTRRNDSGETPFRFASMIRVYCSGAELNPLVACARWGQRAALLTAKINDHPLTEWFLEGLKSYGIQPYFKEFDYDGIGQPIYSQTFTFQPRGQQQLKVGYERRGEAAALLTVRDFDWDSIFKRQGARIFHTGGLFAALSPETSELIVHAIRAAKAGGALISFDLNWREALWRASSGGVARARAVYERIVPEVDVLFGNDGDAQHCLGIAGPAIDTGRGEVKEAEALNPDEFRDMVLRLVQRYPNLKVVATSLRKAHTSSHHGWNAVLWCGNEFLQMEQVELTPIKDRIGCGDAFAGGVLFGLLDGRDPRDALRLGWANGALKAYADGDVTTATLAEVEAFGRSARVAR